MIHLRPALVFVALFTILTGIAYPLAVTGLAGIVLPRQAAGSLVVVGDKVVGSALIGQSFTSDRYLWPRPSATSGPDPADPAKSVDAPYNAAASTGSNLGPTSARLAERLTADVDRLRRAGIEGVVPADAVTTSASGLDPHVSPDFALAQVPRIAAARGRPAAEIRTIVESRIERREAGVFGEPRVNVLAVNLALDGTAVR